MKQITNYTTRGIVLSILCAGALLALSLVLFAHSATAQERGVIDRPQIQNDRAIDATEQSGEDVGENVEERQEEVRQVRAERRATLAEAAKHRIVAFVERMINRMHAALDRLMKLSDRLESRIEKLEERGLDMTAARELLESAVNHIGGAREDVFAIMPAVEEMLASDTPREAFKRVRTVIGEAKTSIKEAHKLLVEAIIAVKAAVGQEEDTEVDSVE